MTLGEWLDRWINEYMIFTIRESTLDSYKAMIKNQIKPYLGGSPVKPDDVSEPKLVNKIDNKEESKNEQIST